MKEKISKILFEKGRTKGIYRPRKRKKSKGWPTKISCLKDSTDTWERKDTKHNCGFIDKFLHKNLGKKWDDIWSEVCCATKDDLGRFVRNAIQSRIKYNYRGFYIEEGILKQRPEKSYKQPKRKSNIVRINNKCYFQYDNIWYEIFPEPLPKSKKTLICDAFHLYTYNPDRFLLTVFYGESVYTKTKRSANSKEIKKIYDSRTYI